MKIKSVTISGLHNIIGTAKTYQFKDINYIIGRNGAGKSTILQAIQLALLGYIPGTDKRTSEIFAHCSGRNMKIELRLTNDSNVTSASSTDVKIVRSWELKGTQLQSGCRVSPEGFDISTLTSQIELPIFNFKDFLCLSRNKLKSWFLDFLPEPECKIDWKQEFESSLKSSGHILADAAYIDEVIEEAVTGDSGLSSVQSTNEHLKEMLAAKKIEVARLEGAVQALIFYDDVEAEDYEASREEKLACIADIKKIRDRVSQVKHIAEANSRIQSQIERASKDRLSAAQISKDQAFIDDYERQHLQDKLAQEAEGIIKKIQDIRFQIVSTEMDIDNRQKVLKGNGLCPYTQSRCEPISAMIETITSEVENLKSELSNLKEQESQCRTASDKINAKKADMSSKYAAAKQNIDRNSLIDLQIKDLNDQLVALSEDEYSLLETSLEDLDYKEQQFQDELSKLEANRVYEARINEITANKFKAENELEALKVWIKRTDANNLQTEIAQLPFAEFVNTMNETIPGVFGETTAFKINLESKANSFSFGISRSSQMGDLYVPYDLMSSGEKTLLAFMMMVYIVTQSSSCLKLVMIDDMLDHLDDVNIITLFEQFANTDIQIINAGVKPLDNSNVNIIEL